MVPNLYFSLSVSCTSRAEQQESITFLAGLQKGWQRPQDPCSISVLCLSPEELFQEGLSSAEQQQGFLWQLALLLQLRGCFGGAEW